MLILPCADLEVKSKKNGGDVVLNITIYRSELKGGKFQKLFDFQEKSVQMALAPEVSREEFQEDLRQMDFLIQCPDCASYDCLIGKKIAVCNTCKKEFAHSPEHKIPTATEEQLKDLFELAREAGFSRKDEKEEIVLILSVLAKILDKPQFNIGPGRKDPIKDGAKVLRKFSKADCEICMMELNRRIAPEPVIELNSEPSREDLIDQAEPDAGQAGEELPEEKPEEEPEETEAEPVRSIDEKQYLGMTPIYQAVSSGNIEAVKIIRHHKPDVNIPDTGGSTPLHIAMVEGFIDIAEILIELGADINWRNDMGLTPLDAAYEYRVEESIDFLEAKGAKRGFALDAVKERPVNIEPKRNPEKSEAQEPVNEVPLSQDEGEQPSPPPMSREEEAFRARNPHFGIMNDPETIRRVEERKAAFEKKKNKYEKPAGWPDEDVEVIETDCPNCRTKEEMYWNTKRELYKCSGCNTLHRGHHLNLPEKEEDNSVEVPEYPHEKPVSWPWHLVMSKDKYCPECKGEYLFWCHDKKSRSKCSNCGKHFNDEKLEEANPVLSNVLKTEEPEENKVENILDENGVLKPEFEDAPF